MKKKNSEAKPKKKTFGERLSKFIRKHEAEINVVSALIFGVIDIVVGALITGHFQKKAMSV